jgi:hypothetical protein
MLQTEFDSDFQRDLPRDASPGESERDRVAVAASLDARTERALELRLHVRDPELVEELGAFPSRRERDEFALAALRLGVLALRTARGQVDAQTVRNEVERMLGELRKGLDEHRSTLQLELEGALREYFDPQSGRFAERVASLTREDGDLAQVIRHHVEGSDSALARTLTSHVGAQSPLLKALDPSSSDGLLSRVGQRLEEALGTQRERILSEFSLDNREGSLARLVAELQRNHGELSEDLQSRIGEVVREFSLDEEDSALSRLVHRVERAQQRIADEFTLDSDTSSLARLRRELMAIAEKQSDTIASLEKKVATELAALTARREADARSPRHGEAFEGALLRWLEQAARDSGDVFVDTRTTTGMIKNRKVGDAMIELGPEQRAAGARIAIEAKEEGGYTLSRARDELELARKNRGAELGIFVLSSRSAPENWPPFQRVGNGIFVTWDLDDPALDVFLEAGLSVARTLCTRSRSDGAREVDPEALERAIRDVEKQVEGLETIRRAADTIETGSHRIRDRVRIMRDNLLKAVESLDRTSEALRRS